MGSVFFDILNAGDVASAFYVIAEKLSNVASYINIPAIVMLVLGAVIALFLGVFGYKYIKLVCAVCFAAAGYGIGAGVFGLLKDAYVWEVPDFVGVLVGVAILALMGFLAFKKFAYALLGVSCFMGFALAYFIYPNYMVALAIGIVVAMLCMNFVRYAFVILTSLFGGFGLIAMLSAMLPAVEMLNLYGFMGKLLALVASLIFVSIQFSITRKESKKSRGARRVKIRRVFDAW